MSRVYTFKSTLTGEQEFFSDWRVLTPAMMVGMFPPVLSTQLCKAWKKFSVVRTRSKYVVQKKHKKHK